MKYRFLPLAEIDFQDAVEKDEVLVLAIANQHRRPGYWKR